MKGFLLVTIGTPHDSSTIAVEDFLSRYLGDRFVISLPQPFRRKLVNNIIIPKHIENSSARYRRLEGIYGGEMPLRMYANRLEESIRKRHPGYETFSIQLHGEANAPQRVIEELRGLGEFESITIVPLYPHQTYSSYASVVHATCQALRRLMPNTKVLLVKPYYNQSEYIDLLMKRIELLAAGEDYDLLACSFHSIPILHQQMGRLQGFNYQAQCKETVDLLGNRLPSIRAKRLLFQSAMGKNWIGPAIETEILRLPSRGIRKVLTICPGFLVDCLETVLDLGDTLREAFLDAGGEKLDLVPSFNADDDAADFFYNLAQNTNNLRRLR